MLKVMSKEKRIIGERLRWLRSADRASVAQPAFAARRASRAAPLQAAE
jgi:hypothetical protein